MKKLIGIITLVTLIAVFASGCGITSTEQTTATSAPSSTGRTEVSAPQQTETKLSPVTIRFMTWNTTEVTLKNAYARFKESYEKSNSHITIEYVDVPYSSIVQQGLTYAAAGDLPDIVEAPTASIGAFITSDYFLPLKGVLSNELLNDLQEINLTEVSYNGEVMAIPRIIIPQLLYYNKTLFEKAGLDPNSPPETYNEMIEMASEIIKLKTEEGEQIYGIGEGLTRASNNGMFSLRNFIGFGANFQVSNGTMSVDAKTLVPALSYFRTIVEKGICPPNCNLKDLRTLFAQERLGMYFDVSNQSATLNSMHVDGKAFEERYAKAKVPVNANGKSNSTSNSANDLISKTTKNSDECAKFIEFLMSMEVYEIYFDENNSLLSTRKSFQDKPLFTEGRDIEIMSQQYPDNMVRFPDAIPNMEEFYFALSDGFQEATGSDTDINTVASKLSEKISNLGK